MRFIVKSSYSAISKFYYLNYHFSFYRHITRGTLTCVYSLFIKTHRRLRNRQLLTLSVCDTGPASRGTKCIATAVSSEFYLCSELFLEPWALSPISVRSSEPYLCSELFLEPWTPSREFWVLSLFGDLPKAMSSEPYLCSELLREPWAPSQELCALSWELRCNTLPWLRRRWWAFRGFCFLVRSFKSGIRNIFEWFINFTAHSTCITLFKWAIRLIRSNTKPPEVGMSSDLFLRETDVPIYRNQFQSDAFDSLFFTADCFYSHATVCSIIVPKIIAGMISCPPLPD